MINITNLSVLALAAFGSVQALPQNYPSGTSTAAAPVATDDQTQLFIDLLTAPTAVKRFQRLLVQGTSLLTGDALRALTVFSFNNATPNPGAKGGALKSANIETFPILTDLGISTTVAFLNPCGINTPHVHPRATEFLTLVEGRNLKFGYVLENGLVGPDKNPEIAGILNKFEGTVFPMGSIHFQFNDNCDSATFVATLNSEDPGTSQIAQNFFALNDEVVNATLGFPREIDGKNIEEFRKYIPANLAQDIEVCLRRCEKKDDDFKKNDDYQKDNDYKNKDDKDNYGYKDKGDYDSKDDHEMKGDYDNKDDYKNDDYKNDDYKNDDYKNDDYKNDDYKNDDYKNDNYKNDDYKSKDDYDYDYKNKDGYGQDY